MSIKRIRESLRNWWARAVETGRRKLNRLWAIIWQVLGLVHLGLVTVAGSLLAVFVPIRFHREIRFDPIFLALWVLYVVCDLVRLRFLQGVTISLGFPLIFWALLDGSPFIALIIATVGSLVSEVLNNQLLDKQQLSWFVTLRRAFFYAGHHAVAGSWALIVYYNIWARVGTFLEFEHISIPSTLMYVVIYSMVSMVLVRPHDIQVRLFFAVGEGPFVRIHWLMSLLLLPIPVSVFYLYEMTDNILIVLGIMPPLFLMLFFLARNFARTEEERERLELREWIRQRLGSPANMAELVEGILTIEGQLVDYRWGAVYSLTDENLELYGVNPSKGRVVARNSGSTEEMLQPQADVETDGREVIWPLQIKSDAGLLEKLACGSQNTQFFYEGHALASATDPYLPPRTALIVFPVIAESQAKDEEKSPLLIGLIALARPKRRFTDWEWEKGQALSSESVNVLLSVQRLERAMREVYQKVADYAEDPERVRQAMRDLALRKVDVSKVLTVVADRAFKGNVRAVLRDLVKGRQSGEVAFAPEVLKDIYERVRDETPGMPSLDSDILELLQTVTSCLSLAFSFRYQFPGVERGEEFKEFYEFLLVALDANTTSRIAALDSQIGSTVEAVRRRVGRQVGPGALPPAAVEEVERLRDVVRLLEDYGQLEDFLDKRASLGQVLQMLEERELSVQEHLRDPERFVFLQILTSWRAAVANMSDEVKRGPARLKVELRRNRALSLEETSVQLVIHNEGPGVARRIEVQLEPCDDFEILEGHADLGALAPGRNMAPTFKLRPMGKGPLRLQFHISYHDPERKGKTEKFADLLHLRELPSGFNEIPNPYTPGPPLRPGDPTFVGREDIFNFIRRNLLALKQKMVLVLIGERRTGKTSILRQLPKRLEDPRYIPIFVDSQSLGIDPGLDSFFSSLALAICDGLDYAGISMTPLGFAEFKEAPQHVFERRFLPMVREQIGNRVLLLTVDEFEELGDRVRRERLPPEIFPYLRHLIQHEEQLAFIFAGTHRVEEMVGDYWSVLFNIAKYKKVGFLEREETVRLITGPVQRHGMVYDDLAIDEVLRLTACHPYFTQMLCTILVTQCNDQECNYVTVRGVRDALEELLETGHAHLTFLWRTSDRDTRLALATLAEQRERLDQVTTAAIAGRLGVYQMRVDPGQVTRAMEKLSARDIVREIPGDPVAYDFTAQLYGYWLRRYQPLSKVVENGDIESSGLPREENAGPASVVEGLSSELITK